MRVEKIAYSGELQAVLPKLGVPGSSADDVAIINNLNLSDAVQSGQLLKVVQPGRP